MEEDTPHNAAPLALDLCGFLPPSLQRFEGLRRQIHETALLTPEIRARLGAPAFDSQPDAPLAYHFA